VPARACRCRPSSIGDLVCPECGTSLSIDRYAGDSPIIINRCPGQHGVWLDRLEVEWIQMIVEGFDV